MIQFIGTCGNCGGRVTVYVGPWLGIIPPVPSCETCHATVQEPSRVLPMNPPDRYLAPAWSEDNTSTMRPGVYRIDDTGKLERIDD